MIRQLLYSLKKNAFRTNTSPYILLVLVHFFLSFTQYTSAQERTSEEIHSKIRKHKEKDTVLVNLYIELSNMLQKEDDSSFVIYGKKAEKLAVKLNYTEGLGNAYYQRGIIYRKKAEIDSSRFYYTKALKTYESVKLTEKYYHCYNGIGVTYYMEGEYDKALKLFKKCVELGKENDQVDITMCLSNIGSIYGRKDQYEKAIHYFNKALKIREEKKDTASFSNSYNNLGLVYQLKGDLIKAQEYLQKSIQIQKKRGNELGLISSYLNIGRIYFNLEDNERALSYYLKSEKLAKKHDDKFGIMSALGHEGDVYNELNRKIESLQTQKEVNRIAREIGAQQKVSISLNQMGSVYHDLDSLDKALVCFTEAKEIQLKIGNPSTLARTYFGIARVYFKQKQWRKSLKNAIKSKELMDKTNRPIASLNFEKLLSEIYEAMGNFQQAHIHFKRHTKIKDSLYNKKSLHKLAQLEYEHMYSDSLELASQRELILSNQIKQSELDSAKSAQFNLSVVIGLLSIVLIAVLVISFLLVRNTKTKFKNIEIEQKLLRTQMTPHFLFNSMSIIQGMILNGAYKKSLNYLNDFSKLLRLTLENSRNKTVSLEKELDAIKSYVELQNNTSEKPYKCRIQLNSGADPKKIVLPPMLIQPFVENAIEHGFEDENDDKQIDITIQFNEGNLVCVITDNGIGINKTILDKNVNKTSMATQITKDRLKLLASEFKVHTDFSIKDREIFSEKGTIVNLVLPHKILEND